MSTIHTEASVAASEVEPSERDIYDYSESINDNDEKLDEGLRAPIPIHDDEMADTSLLSDNELEAFVKTKHYQGKASSIPPNLTSIFQRLSGYSKWSSDIYSKLQSAPATTKQIDTPQIEQAFIDNIISETSSILVQPEQSPFPSITPAQSQANMIENIDSDTEERYKPRKQTLPFTILPSSPSMHNGAKDKEEKKDIEAPQAVNDCTVKELMKMVGNLTSEVIHLQQNLYIKDIMIKNMYLRLREFHHISFPQLMIERIHIVANYNNKHKFSHMHKRDKLRHGAKRMTLSEEDSVSHGGTAMMTKHHANSSYTISSTMKHHSTVTLEVITRWMPRYNLPTALKKGLVFLKEDDLDDIDDYLSHQMWSEWQERCKLKYSISGLDKMKREEVHKTLENYLQHERVGLVRIEIFRGKKYKKYKRIEKKFESLIIPIPDIPKGDTYHILIKVHNPSASIWGPLSNMLSVKVPLKFIEDDDEETVTREKKTGHRISDQFNGGLKAKK